MKKILYYLLLMLVISSCRLFKQDVNEESVKYVNKKGYKNFYIVDTIIIDNPVRFFTKEGYQFVMSQKSFNSFNGKTSSLFKRNDAFLLDHYFPMDVPFDVYGSYLYLYKKSYGCSEYSIRLPLKKKGVSECYAYSIKLDYFVLIFIRGDYYNEVYAGIDGSPIIKKDKNRYYKMVIPFCTEN